MRAIRSAAHRRRRLRMAAVLAAATLAGPLTAPAPAPAQAAPGAPGAKATWSSADKEGFGTSTTGASRVWFTLNDGALSEVYYPDLGTPSVRDLQLVVSDGSTFAERETTATDQRTERFDRNSLTFRQVNTAKSGRYRITKTYVTDPSTHALMVEVRFESLDGGRYRVYALYDPSLGNGGFGDSGFTDGGRLVATDGRVASALRAEPAFAATSTGFMGTSDGWTDLRSDHRMDWRYTTSNGGNVVQTGETTLNGVERQRLTLALGFGDTANLARSATAAALGRGFGAVSTAYANGWHAYVGSLRAPPASAAPFPNTYAASTMTLAAHEDKTYRGAYIASPTMPWAWGTGLDDPSGAYHLVWARDLYQIATALLAAGDRAGAERALTYLFDRQQRPDGGFPQNSTVDGSEHWGGTQLDQVAGPILLAWQLGRTDADTWVHVQRAADYIVRTGPTTAQERWENQGGWSPATIAAEIAGLVCAAEIARVNGDTATAQRYLDTADAWQRSVQGWTATTNGPLSASPYYLRLAKDGRPDDSTPYRIGDGGPSAIDQRRVVDPSFLELVRLGVKAPDDPVIRNTLTVVDQQLGVQTSNGTFWHRYNFDGYGEKRDGAQWDLSPDDSYATIGRAWPLFAGERGEYELANGGSANDRLLAMALSGNDGHMLPEQVWDQNQPSGGATFRPGEGTRSATPLAWTHAQFIRLAWSIQAGRPVERPAVVACRYTRRDC